MKYFFVYVFLIENWVWFLEEVCFFMGYNCDVLYCCCD